MKYINSVTEIYVDPINGHDWFSGITPIKGDSGPVKTIETALRHITELRDMGCMQPVTIYMMGEEYIVPKTIKIEKNMGNITFESFDEKKTVIRAGGRLENFYETEFNGVKCIAAKVPEEFIPYDLFVNGKRAELTRYPEEGYLYPEETGSKTMQLYDCSDWFIAEEKDRSFFEKSDLEDAVISFNHYWVDEHTAVESYCPKTGKVIMTKIPRFTIFSKNRSKNGTTTSNVEYSTMEYYIENVRSMFRKENQWYYDKKEGIVYYIPENGKAIDELEIFMPYTDHIFNIDADRVNFKNLGFEYTSSKYGSDETEEKTQKLYACDKQSVWLAGGVINFNNASNCTIADCSFMHYGLYGVVVGEGCHNININGNTFFDCGAGGVKIFGSNEPEEEKKYTYGNSITNNTITHCGIRHAAGCGVLVMHSFENKISHNEICYTYYTGISVGWVWGYFYSNTHDNIIEKNHIHHIGQGALSDMGGIYLLGPQSNSFVTGNLIHDCRCRYYGGQGIYIDEGTSYVTLENNICYNVDSCAINLHFGFMNVTRNNILEAGDKGALNHWRQELHIGEVEYRNILYSKNNRPLYGAAGEDVVIDSFISDNNLLYAFGQDEPTMYIQNGVRKYYDDALREHELNAGGIIADPEFADLENGDFTISDNSPAKKLRFRNIDMSDVGPIKRK